MNTHYNMKHTTSPSTGAGSTAKSLPGGFPLPMLQNQYYLDILELPPTATLKQQMISCYINFIDRILGCEIEQPRNMQMFIDLLKLQLCPFTVVLTPIDINANPIGTLKFTECSIATHDTEFNYASSNTVRHIISIDYVDVEVN